MDTTRLRRTGALIVSAALLASLTVATVAAPASAAPTCDGKSATITDNNGTDNNPAVGFIEGTSGPDVIVGSGGSDVINGLGGRDLICGLGDADAIDGGAGNDRIFGGGGDDQIVGGRGQDTIFGYNGDDELFGDFIARSSGARDVIKGGSGDDDIFGGGGPDVLKGNDGNDEIYGNRGNDTIDGGAQTDECLQGSGSGRITHCEKADLKVTVIGPANATAGTVNFKVRVKNLGPQAASYSYDLDEENNQATCNGPQPWEGTHSFAKLRRGATRTRSYDVTCTVNNPGAWVEVTARVDSDARDPKSANNKHKRRTNLEE